VNLALLAFEAGRGTIVHGTTPRRVALDLVQPLGGLFHSVDARSAYGDQPRLTMGTVRSGNLTYAWPRQISAQESRPIVIGSGIGLDQDDCILAAVGEAVERYCVSAYKDDQFVWATAKELGADALDLDTIPRCSTVELSHPKCPLTAPDKRVKIRWVKGLSLLDGRSVYVPAIMVYLYLRAANAGERIWVPISTGCAAHVSYEWALIAAILEVVERDALSITWLQQLSLPRLEIDCIPPQLATHWERYQRSSKDLGYLLFDATTDVGFPTVYGLQLSDIDQRRATLVSCATALNPIDALAKILRDMVFVRAGSRASVGVPESWDDFTSLAHGATYMASAERSHAFDFLRHSESISLLSEMATVQTSDPKTALVFILDQLRRKNIGVFAVDLTTDEVVRYGMKAVRVVVPNLQPFAFRYLARFLGHPRLYDAPRNMGYSVRSEENLNKWPQPFA
jgi:ribosomal protein S12 methylthiotransferase accessory factor